MKPFSALLLVMLMIVSCSKAVFNESTANDDQNFSNSYEAFNPNVPALIGEERELPYELDNMRRAFEEVATKSGYPVSAQTAITNTHDYVKFEFRSEEEYDHIKGIGIDLSYIPLTANIIRGGYLELDGNKDGITEMYAIIPVHLLESVAEKGIAYSILSHLSIPDEDECSWETKAISKSLISDVVLQAYHLSGNDDWIASSSTLVHTKASKTPSGCVLYRDYSLSGTPSNIGMEGLTVKAKRVGKVSTGVCDKNGYYVCDKDFQYKWTYEIDFEKYDFQIRHGTAGRFIYVSEKTDSPINVLISDQSSEGYFIATIFRACYQYYYGEIDGLRRPPLNSFWKTQMHIAAIFKAAPDGDYANTNMARRFLGIGNAIKIYKDTNFPNLFDSTIHELCHASHWNHSKTQYSQNTEEIHRLRESLANGIARYLTDKKYPGWKGLYYGSNKAYTHIVDDLLDNLVLEIGYGKKYPEDRVEGYSIKQVEDAAVGAASTIEWKNNLYSIDPQNSSRQYLDTLFDAWYK